MRRFAFHGCLGPATKQADVLRACGITQLLDAALAGFHVTIMTYGQVASCLNTHMHAKVRACPAARMYWLLSPCFVGREGWSGMALPPYFS
jgi:hypothetical protein